MNDDKIFAMQNITNIQMQVAGVGDVPEVVISDMKDKDGKPNYNTQGVFNPSQNTITVNENILKPKPDGAVKPQDAIIGTLLHEGQHAIQYDMGKNPENYPLSIQSQIQWFEINFIKPLYIFPNEGLSNHGNYINNPVENDSWFVKPQYQSILFAKP